MNTIRTVDLPINEKIERQVSKNKENHQLIQSFLNEIKRVGGDLSKMTVKMGSARPTYDYNVSPVSGQKSASDRNSSTKSFENGQQVEFINDQGVMVRGQIIYNDAGVPIFIQDQPLEKQMSRNQLQLRLNNQTQSSTQSQRGMEI